MRQPLKTRTILLRTMEQVNHAVHIIVNLPLDDKKPLEIVVREKKDTRTSDMNAKFHAICSDIAKSCFQWAGKKRTADQWKVLLVSGHAHATKENVELIAGLENEFINIRESTALMSIKRGSSLIEYSLAFCANNEIKLSAKEYE